MSGEPAHPADPAATCSRRDALRLALGAPALTAIATIAPIAPLVALAGCRSEPAPPPGTVIELSRLPEGERVVVMRDEEPIELVRTGSEVRVRSLWCTHMGCRVRWVAADELYSCPCHAGIFDPDGRPIAGPPTLALRTTTLAAAGERVVIPPRSPQERPLPPRPDVPAPKGDLV